MRTVILAVLCSVIWPGTGLCLEKEPVEDRAKAERLYYLNKFIRPPVDKQEFIHNPQAICILGDNRLYHSFTEVLRGKESFSAPPFLKNAPPLSCLDFCKVLYIGDVEPDIFRKATMAVKELPVLTVSSGTASKTPETIVSFIKKDSQIRMRVNQGAAARAGLRLSSELLDVATSFNDQS